VNVSLTDKLMVGILTSERVKEVLFFFLTIAFAARVATS